MEVTANHLDSVDAAIKKGRYHYYRCFHCREESLPLEDAHNQLTDLLDRLKLPINTATSIRESLEDALGAENRSSETQRQELERTVNKDNERLEALEDELFNPKNPELDQSRLAERVKKLQLDIAQKQLALNALRSHVGIDLDKAFLVLDTLLANPNGVLSGLSDADKAAFVFVLLPEKVICKDKRLQTAGSLVPEGVFTSSRSSSAGWHPNGLYLHEIVNASVAT